MDGWWIGWALPFVAPSLCLYVIVEFLFSIHWHMMHVHTVQENGSSTLVAIIIITSLWQKFEFLIMNRCVLFCHLFKSQKLSICTLYVVTGQKLIIICSSKFFFKKKAEILGRQCIGAMSSSTMWASQSFSDQILAA